MIVLVTGFGPYLRQRRNPTGELAQAVDGRRMGTSHVVGRVLPTEFRACERSLRRAVRECRPDALVMFGLAPGRRRLAIEAVAMNVDHAEDPDNAGKRAWRRPIKRGGPRLIDSTLPIDRLHEALKRARIPVAVSYHAGTYVCNHAFYVGARMARRAGFVHVPKWGPGRLRRALEVIVRALGR